MTIALMVLGAAAQAPAPAPFMAAGTAIAKINSFGMPG